LCFGKEFPSSLKNAINKLKEIGSEKEYEKPEHFVLIFLN
jgi:hypothetical protein